MGGVGGRGRRQEDRPRGSSPQDHFRLTAWASPCLRLGPRGRLSSEKSKWPPGARGCWCPQKHAAQLGTDTLALDLR